MSGKAVAGQDRWFNTMGPLILVCLCLIFCFLFARLIHINTYPAEKLRRIVDRQQRSVTPVPARRGSVFDVEGRLLAGTRLRPSVFADPSLIDNFSETARKLAPVLELPAGAIEQELREARERRSRFCWLKRGLESPDALAVQALRLRGIGTRDEPKRFYLMGSLMSQTLGIVSRDGNGLEGLEYYYDEHLRGVDGRRVTVRDGSRSRRLMRSRDEQCVDPRDGGHLVLTLDSVIQSSLEKHLREAVLRFEASGGVGVVMSPHTGDVLAMGQWPTFDANTFRDADASDDLSNDASEPEDPKEREKRALLARRNRAVCNAVEPGSIFKPFVASGALLAGVVDLEESFDCGRGTHLFGRRLMHDSHASGVLDFNGIIAQSSNIGMGYLAERMGDEAIYNIVRSFGFGRRTGVKFPGEATGLLRPLKRWTSWSTTSIPIGQEVAVTPLQMTSSFCAIVNGGVLLKPRLVRAILSSDGRCDELREGADVVREVLSAEVADYMREVSLVGVVKHGGGKTAALDRWQVLGKTGTAQVPYEDAPGYEPDMYIGSFVGAAPAENPVVVVLVMIHKPRMKLGYYGSKVAAPAVGRILEDVLTYWEIPASPNAADEEWALDSGDEAMADVVDYRVESSLNER